jgi:hypothetical protein
MKKSTILFVFIALFNFATIAQNHDIAISTSLGASNYRPPVAQLDVSYLNKEISVGVGYVASISNRADIPQVFYGRINKRFYTNIFDDTRNVFEIGGGMAYHAYSTYYSNLRGWKPFVNVTYENFVLDDGSFIINANYTGQQFSLTFGVRYFFKRKERITGCRM